MNELLEYLPHRPPAVWIDEATPDACYVELKTDAPYMTGGKLRRTSLIEFIAQSFGYQAAAKALASKVKPSKSSKAYLVAVTKCALKDTGELKSGDRLKIVISDINQVGPITLFNSTVTDPHGTELARASLKVFSEGARSDI